MTLDFDFDKIRVIEFGVGIDETDGQSFYSIPVDGDVQDALKEMAVATWDAMQDTERNPSRYEPSEKYASMEHVVLPLDNRLAQKLRELHQAQNLPVDSIALSEPSEIFCYFARMTDAQSRRLTAVRRATQFKGVLKNRLIRLVTDALKLIEDRVFKLDNDFDLLIDSANVHILRPSGFEFVCQLQASVMAAAQKNIAEIQRSLPFVDFTNIEAYASTHTRAARYLASIRTQELKDIDKAALRKMCKNTGVEVQMVNRKITIEDGHVMGFLEVLDRRRYQVDLVRNSPERFKASSRRKINS